VLTSFRVASYQSAALPGRRAFNLATDHSGLNKFNHPEDEELPFGAARDPKNGPGGASKDRGTVSRYDLSFCLTVVQS